MIKTYRKTATFQAEQFNPRKGVPEGVIDLLRSNLDYDLQNNPLDDVDYEWAIEATGYDDSYFDYYVGLKIGDWIVRCGDSVTVYSNKAFKKAFKEEVE